MVALRKTSCYSKMKVVPYTRWSRRKQKAFIKMMPAQKIVKFSMGKGGEYNSGKLPLILTVVSAEKVQVQVRHNALEACRQVLNKKLNEALNGQYFLKVVPFPHHIQRENKMLTGAGADRMQTGMQLSFGKAIAKAALLKKEAPLFIIAVSTEKGIRVARKALKEIKSKLPLKMRIDFKDLTKETKPEVKKESKKE
jgi:large subunit ribosomal protein L10e